LSTLAVWRSIDSGELVSDTGRPATRQAGVTKPGVTRYWWQRPISGLRFGLSLVRRHARRLGLPRRLR